MSQTRNEVLRWSLLRHRTLRSISRDRNAFTHDGATWLIRVRLSTRSQMARAANELWHAGLVDLVNEGWTEPTEQGRRVLAEWDWEHGKTTSTLVWSDTDMPGVLSTRHEGRSWYLVTHSANRGKSGWSGTDEWHLHADEVLSCAECRWVAAPGKAGRARSIAEWVITHTAEADRMHMGQIGAVVFERCRGVDGRV